MYQTHRFSSGIKLVHRQISNGVAHCGLIINTGSRDEAEDENGIAHFIEHMVFKGTRKRKAISYIKPYGKRWWRPECIYYQRRNLHLLLISSGVL